MPSEAKALAGETAKPQGPAVEDREISDDERAMLEVMLDDVRRLLDGQLKAAEELDDKSETCLKIATANFVLGISLVVFLISEVNRVAGLPKHITSITILAGVGFVFGFASFVVLMQAYISLKLKRPHTLNDAPGPDWIIEKLEDADHGYDEHLQAMVGGLAGAAQRNNELLPTSSAKRTLGMQLVMVAHLSWLAAGAILCLDILGALNG